MTLAQNEGIQNENKTLRNRFGFDHVGWMLL
jgi:hypothetical protein